jgi:class 3 adenylate cyclase
MTAEGNPVADGPAAASGEAQTRGFLFADIRGYTEYVERRGATAAAEMLGRYRSAVRAAIAEYRGAEIRTEGDSFYVVLPSASSAVVCALAILERVNDENAGGTDESIRVGIGVHAGEAIDSKEGLVGSAVNIAARLSALARPGEVLVSDTVRSLTRSVIPVAYVPRGRHRLKGVADVQEVFAAATSTPGAAPLRMRRVARPVAAAAGAVVLAAVVGLVYVAFPAGTPTATASPSTVAALPTATVPAISTVSPIPTFTSAPSPTATPGPSVMSITPDFDAFVGFPPPLKTGRYRFNTFRPILVFSIDPTWTDRTWRPYYSSADRAFLILTQFGGVGAALPPHDEMDTLPGMMLVEFLRVQTVFGNPCDPGDTSTNLLGGRPRDMINWLAGQRFLAATNPQPVTVAGWTGLSVDTSVVNDPGEACAGLEVPHQGSVYLFRSSQSTRGSVFKLRDGQQARITVLDVGEDSPLVIVSYSAIKDFSPRVAWSDQLLDTITPGG